MPCDQCKRKGIPIACNYCTGNFCTRCILLEIHNCKGMEKKQKKDIKILESKLAYEAPRKIEQI